MKFLGIAIAMAITIMPSAVKAEWIHVSTSDRGDRVYINDATIKFSGKYVRFGMVGEFVEGNRTAIILSADCSTGQFQKQDVVENGLQIRPSKGKFPIQQATMGTLYGAAVQYACSAR